MPENELDFSLLPEELQELAPLIAKYGEGDDADREALLEGSSDEELRALSAAADPHWDAINGFLDANMETPGPGQDLAIALDAFALAAMEARSELEGRETS